MLGQNTPSPVPVYPKLCNIPSCSAVPAVPAPHQPGSLHGQQLVPRGSTQPSLSSPQAHGAPPAVCYLARSFWLCSFCPATSNKKATALRLQEFPACSSNVKSWRHPCSLCQPLFLFGLAALRPSPALKPTEGLLAPSACNQPHDP